MKYALVGVGSGSTIRPEPLAEVATMAETLGFESLWIPEHLAVPVEMQARYPGSADGTFPGGPGVNLHDPFVALSFVAARTKTIKLATGVFVLPLRNTLTTAKAVASLDVLSCGRVIFGIGVGWCEEEFEAVGMSFRDRVSRTREALEVMRELWTAEYPRFAGQHHKFAPLGFNPKPVQVPYPPIVFGGESEAALKRAAQLADGWCGIRHSPDSVGAYIGRLKALVQEAGRDFSQFEVTVGMESGIVPTVDTIKKFEDAGVHRLFVFAPGWVPRRKFKTDLFPQMEAFANDVMRKV